MRVIYRKIRHARYLYIKRNVEKVWGARYTLGARYLSKNTVSSELWINPKSTSTVHSSGCLVIPKKKIVDEIQVFLNLYTDR